MAATHLTTDANFMRFSTRTKGGSVSQIRALACLAAVGPARWFKSDRCVKNEVRFETFEVLRSCEIEGRWFVATNEPEVVLGRQK